MKKSIKPISKFIFSSNAEVFFKVLNTGKRTSFNLFYCLNRKISVIRKIENETSEFQVNINNLFNVISFYKSENGTKNRICTKYIIYTDKLKVFSFLYKLLEVTFSLKRIILHPISFVTILNDSKFIFTGKISNSTLNKDYFLTCGKTMNKIAVSENGCFDTSIKMGKGLKLIKILKSTNQSKYLLVDLRLVYVLKNVVQINKFNKNKFNKWNRLYNTVKFKKGSEYKSNIIINIFLNAMNSNTNDIIEFLKRFDNFNTTNINLFVVSNKSSIKKYFLPKKVKFIYEDTSFSSGVNSNLFRVKNGFIFLVRTKTKLPYDFFYVVSTLINKATKLIYFDEKSTKPFNDYQFKPSFDKIYLLSKNYIGTTFCISNELLKKYKLNEESGICPFYYLLLETCFTLKKSEVIHSPLILENNEIISSCESITNETLKSFTSNELQVSSKFGSSCLLPSVLKLNNSVSLIIPTAGNIQLLRKFLNSILTITTGINYDIIIVTHSSNFLNREKSIFFDKISSPCVRVIKHDILPFNYSTIINYAVSFSKSPYICLLNDDMEILNGNWLSELLRWFTLKDTGVVGSLLLYPDNKIQHAGISLGLNQTCDHPDKGFSRFGENDLLHINHSRSVTAVTGACLLIKKETFIAVDGMNPLFAEAFNDVDLCLKVRKKGYNVIITPHSVIRHYESQSVGHPLSNSRRIIFRHEINLFLKLHNDSIVQETFYSKNFSQHPPYYKLAKPPRNNFYWRLFQNKKSAEEKPKFAWKTRNFSQSGKVCIFSHYDEHNEIQDHVIYYLNELNNLNWLIFFVTSCTNLKLSQRSKIENITSTIICSNGKGRDWGNYAMGYIFSRRVTKAKSILFTNDSVWGPITSLKPFFILPNKVVLTFLD